MDFRILGPLEVRDGDREVRLRGGKQRALLALLLVHANRTLAIDRIVDELWGEEVPETAQKMVQIYVSHLRKLLPSGTLHTRPPGYMLALEPDQLDLNRFERLVADARAALEAGRAAEAAGGFRAALELWRGPALAEFAMEPFAQPEAARLEELRVAVLERRLEADLRLGATATSPGSSKRSSLATRSAKGYAASRCSRSTGPAVRRRRLLHTSMRGAPWPTSSGSSPRPRFASSSEGSSGKT